MYAYPGELDVSAETLSLLKRTTGEVIDRVRYESVPPWPRGADGHGSALQVIDVNEDNSRVSNWSDGLPWRYVTFTGTILGSPLPGSRGTNFLIFINLPGTVYVDDMVLVRGSIPEVGENVLANGGFEAPIEGTWTPVGNHSGSSRSTEASHSGQASLKVVSTGVGSSIAHVRQVIPGNPTNAVYTLSFWLIPSTNAAQLTARTSPGSLFIFQTPLMPVIATPGQSNSFVMDLPPYDPIWLNELYFTFEPAIEIYNSGTNRVSLENYYFSQDYDSLSVRGGIPPGRAIDRGEYEIIFAGISPTRGKLALVRDIGWTVQIVDYFNFDSTLYGAVPDGQPFTRGPLRYPTFGKSNLSPRIKSIRRFPGITYLVFQVTPGYRYYAEYKDNLNDPAWLSFDGDYLVADGPELEFADTLPGTGRRFYRLTLVNAVQ
jgi:hypothetical protein